LQAITGTVQEKVSDAYGATNEFVTVCNRELMTPLAAKLIWFLGVAGWFVIRYPHQRRSRRTPMARRHDRPREFVLLGVAALGMFVIPLVYCLSSRPRFAEYPFSPLQAWCGVIVFAAALYLFHRTHRDLGRNWSVTLEIRDGHALVTSGIYARIRHPMYLAFWLWALAQALLLPNWIAGPAGLAGFGTLFFLRVGREERMMLDAFGTEYRAYMARTYRIIPGIYCGCAGGSGSTPIS
jgi:protein-S-isoprenylcysteine O-methyltransferase Ste14